MKHKGLHGYAALYKKTGFGSVYFKDLSKVVLKRTVVTIEITIYVCMYVSVIVFICCNKQSRMHLFHVMEIKRTIGDQQGQNICIILKPMLN